MPLVDVSKPTTIFRAMIHCPKCGMRAAATGYRDDLDPYDRTVYVFDCRNCELEVETRVRAHDSQGISGKMQI